MRVFLAKAKRFVQLSPALALAGMGLVSYGVALFSLPGGLITGGVLLIVAAVDMRL
jgi:hypothetical protein